MPVGFPLWPLLVGLVAGLLVMVIVLCMLKLAFVLPHRHRGRRRAVDVEGTYLIPVVMIEEPRHIRVWRS